MQKIKKLEWDVRPVSISVARRMVEQNHYAGGASNTRTFLHGLFKRESFFDEECQGVAWWIPPTKAAAFATYPDNWRGVLSLSRLVILPGVPSNACSFLLGRSIKLIPSDVWPCLVTYADTWRGHTGAIYRATNWEYCGLTKPERVYQVDGVMKARKAGGRTRTHAEMLELGGVVAAKSQKHKFRLVR